MHREMKDGLGEYFFTEPATDNYVTEKSELLRLEKKAGEAMKKAYSGRKRKLGKTPPKNGC